MQKITPCLWFNGRVEEALSLYSSVFKEAKVKDISHYGPNAPMPEGQIMVATFYIEGQEFMILNGGNNFTPDEATSFVIHCKDQAEVDHYWNSLTANGGRESMCGWLKDPFGVSWQVVPTIFSELIHKDSSGKIFAAMLQMKKIDIAKLEEAFNP
jgi:predicted 3-demethylubiquinone-9 3-methyltransferase (glyoxalase superfamily)